MCLGDVLSQEAYVSLDVVRVVGVKERKDTLHILHVLHEGLDNFLQGFDEVFLDAFPQVRLQESQLRV